MSRIPDKPNSGQEMCSNVPYHKKLVIREDGWKILEMLHLDQTDEALKKLFAAYNHLWHAYCRLISKCEAWLSIPHYVTPVESTTLEWATEKNIHRAWVEDKGSLDIRSPGPRERSWFWVRAVKEIIEGGSEVAPVFKNKQRSIENVAVAFKLLRWIHYHKRGDPFTTRVPIMKAKAAVLPKKVHTFAEDIEDYPINFEFRDEIVNRMASTGTGIRTVQKNVIADMRKSPEMPRGYTACIQAEQDFEEKSSDANKSLFVRERPRTLIELTLAIIVLRSSMESEFDRTAYQSDSYVESCNSLKLDPRNPVLGGMTLVLKPHQPIAIDWMWKRTTNLGIRQITEPIGCGILADGMGLGKTAMIIGYIVKLQTDWRQVEPKASRFAERIPVILLSVPTQIISQFESDIKRWAPTLKYYSYWNKRNNSPLADITRSDFRKGGRFDPFNQNAPHVITTTHTFFPPRHPSPFVWDKDSSRENDIRNNIVDSDGEEEEVVDSENMEDGATRAYNKEKDLEGCFHTLIMDEFDKLKRGRTGQRGASYRNLRALNRFAISGTPLSNRYDSLLGGLDILMPIYRQGEYDFGFSEEEEKDQMGKLSRWDDLTSLQKCTPLAFKKYIKDKSRGLIKKSALGAFLEQQLKSVECIREILALIMIRRTQSSQILSARGLHPDCPTAESTLVGFGMKTAIVQPLWAAFTDKELRTYLGLVEERGGRLFKGGDKEGGWQNGTAYRFRSVLSSTLRMADLNQAILKSRWEKATGNIWFGNSGEKFIEERGSRDEFEGESDEDTESEENGAADPTMLLEVSSKTLGELRVGFDFDPKLFIPLLLARDEKLPRDLPAAFVWYHKGFPKLDLFLKILEIHIINKPEGSHEKIILVVNALSVGLVYESYLRGMGIIVKVIHSTLGSLARARIIDSFNDPIDMSIEVLIVSSALVGFGLNFHKGARVMVTNDGFVNDEERAKMAARVNRIDAMGGAINYSLFTAGTFEHSIYIRNSIKHHPIMEVYQRDPDEAVERLQDMNIHELHTIWSGMHPTDDCPKVYYLQAMKMLTKAAKLLAPKYLSTEDIVEKSLTSGYSEENEKFE